MSIRNNFECKKPTWTKLQLNKDANLKKRQMEKMQARAQKVEKKRNNIEFT